MRQFETADGKGALACALGPPLRFRAFSGL
jgi:hypothetical protein